jgi:two-component system chemotaxis response regulator CheY
MAKTALVVDDSASMRQMITMTLRSAGFEILEEPNGQAAIDTLAGKGPVDLIITDLNMPLMDGFTFIRNARQMPMARTTPILMLTTERSEERKMEGKAAGATGWIAKPFDPDQLIAVVKKVVHL